MSKADHCLGSVVSVCSSGHIQFSGCLLTVSALAQPSMELKFSYRMDNRKKNIWPPWNGKYGVRISFNSAFSFLECKTWSDAMHSGLEREVVTEADKGMPTKLYPLPISYTRCPVSRNGRTNSRKLDR